MRGSIPTYWSQDPNTLDPMPPINIYRNDTEYTASLNHFSNVMRRYGNTVIILDLVKHIEKNKREMLIGSDYRKCVAELNLPLPLKFQLRYIAIDYTALSK